MELADVVDSKSTAGDSVPVRVRPPAPINATENDTFSVAFILCWKRTRTAGESLATSPSAAGGRSSDLSEWQGSARDAAAPTARTFAGDPNRTPGTQATESEPAIPRRGKEQICCILQALRAKEAKRFAKIVWPLIIFYRKLLSGL